MSRRRDEQNDWDGDAHYEAWRRGVPERYMDCDRMSDAFHNGQSPEGYVGGICRRMEDARQARDQEVEEAYYREIEQAHYESLEQAACEGQADHA